MFGSLFSLVLCKIGSKVPVHSREENNAQGVVLQASIKLFDTVIQLLHLFP